MRPLFAAERQVVEAKALSIFKTKRKDRPEKRNAAVLPAITTRTVCTYPLFLA